MTTARATRERTTFCSGLPAHVATHATGIYVQEKVAGARSLQGQRRRNVIV